MGDKKTELPETFRDLLDTYSLTYHGWFADSAGGFLAPFSDAGNPQQTLQLVNQLFERSPSPIWQHFSTEGSWPTLVWPTNPPEAASAPEAF